MLITCIALRGHWIHVLPVFAYASLHTWFHRPQRYSHKPSNTDAIQAPDTAPSLQQGYDLIFIGAAQVVLPVLLHCLQDLVQEISLHAWGLGHAQPLPMNSFSDLSLCHRCGSL